ncbi:hypothetical protein [Nonomuraea typhae]|uniref:hypothetical protein n=1 Tax=Nonomuraea typhae TaxID=2603600 RepID=UPI0012F920FB|nr:hypothetical protein [Nonomuraea typhae]
MDPSPLSGIAYTDQEVRLWRWIESPRDAEIRAVLDKGLDPGRLSMDELYLLISFTRRCALAAARTGDPAPIRYGYAALAALDQERMDRRDVIWAGAVLTWAAQRLGLDAAALAATATAQLSRDAAALIVGTTGTRVDLSGDWGFIPRETPDGLVLFGTEHAYFAPESDLTAMTVALADEIERAGYRITSLTLGSEFPTVWVGGRTRLTRGLTGCTDLHADQDDIRDGLLVFLLEAPRASRAAAIAAAATANEHVLALASGKVAAVLSLMPGHTLPPIHFEPMIRRILAQA